MTKKYIAMIACAALSACSAPKRDGITEENWGSPEYAQSTLVKLVEIDGCNIYRFHDYGGAQYATICTGAPKMPPAPDAEALPTQKPTWRK